MGWTLWIEQSRSTFRNGKYGKPIRGLGPTKGAAGVDGQTIADFLRLTLSSNLYTALEPSVVWQLLSAAGATGWTYRRAMVGLGHWEFQRSPTG